MKESTRQHYRAEILRALQEEGAMPVGSLRHRVQPPPTSTVKAASEETVREVRREMEAEGLLESWNDTSQRNNPLMVALALSGPRQIRSVTLVVDAVGLPAGSVAIKVHSRPVDVRHLPALVAEAVRRLFAEHSVALNLAPAQTGSIRTG